MRLSELLHLPVYDADGRHAGWVHDVRAAQEGPLIGTWGAAFAIQGLLVTPHKWVGELGFRSGSEHGLWLIRILVNVLNRKSVYVPWADVESVDNGDVRLSARLPDLSPIPPAPVGDQPR